MFKGKFNKNLLTGILASLAINIGGGVVLEKKYQETEQARLQEDRERTKDVIFLPTTKEELVQNLLKQAGVANIEEIQKNPELAHKINLGVFFLQVEFLEKKIDAKQAKKAFLNLQLQERVFADLYDKTKNPLLVINELQNNIADPQIFLDENDKIEVKKNSGSNDYKSGEALLSSYALYGQSNCYSSTRVLVSLLTRILPKHKIKINELSEHVRVVVQDEVNKYLVDTGTPIRKITPEDLAGTVLYEDAHLAFLSGILKLPNPHQYFELSATDDHDSKDRKHASISEDTKTNEYKNTSIGNYFDYTPTQMEGKRQLKSLTNLPIPELADRQRVKLSPELESGQVNDGKKLKTTNDLGEAKINNIIKSDTKSEKIEILKKEAEKNEATADKTEIEVSKKPILEANYIPTNEQKKQFLILEADPMIMAFVKESIEKPEKKEENTKEIFLWLQKLDRNGALPKYADQIIDENEKLNAIRPKAEDKSNPYLMAKFLLGDYIVKYWEFKDKIDEKELLKDAESLILNTVEDANVLFGSIQTEDEKNPISRKNILVNEIPDITNKILKVLKRTKRAYSIDFSEQINDESVRILFDIAKTYPPEAIEISGSDFKYLSELQSLLDSPKAKNTIVRWSNPAPGMDISPIEKAVIEQRIYFRDLKFINKINTLQDVDKQFSMVDKETRTIVNVITPELRDKFGKEFLIEYFLRTALDTPNNHVFEISNLRTKSNDFDLPKSALQEFEAQDFGYLQHLITKFSTSFQKKFVPKYTFKAINPKINNDGFDFINNFDFKQVAKYIEINSIINIKTNITNFPTEDIKSQKILLEDATFEDIPSEFLINNRNIDFGDIAFHSGLDLLDFKRQLISIDQFLDKISKAEMEDILIYNSNERKADGNSTYTIFVKTNTRGFDTGKFNYSFKFELVMKPENYNNDYDLIIKNIFRKLKAKKIFIGYDSVGLINMAAQEIVPHTIIEKKIF